MNESSVGSSTVDAVAAAGRDRLERASRTRRRSLGAVIVAVIVLYGAFFVAVEQLGVLELDAQTSDARVIAAFLTLTGGVLASSLTLMGVLLKHSIDNRNAMLAEQAESRLSLDAERGAELAREAEQRLAIESERAARVADDSEKRLRLEASIKAVELLTLDDGSPAPPTQQAGALFVLTSLDQFPLAISLLGETWRAGGLSARGAVDVINQALSRADEYVKLAAARVLEQHADLLPYKSDEGGNIPDVIGSKWPTELLSVDVRWTLIDTLVAALLSRSGTGWTTNPTFVNWVVVQLYVIRTQEPEPFLRASADVVLLALLESDLNIFEVVVTASGEIDTAALRQELESGKEEAEALAVSTVREATDDLRALR